MDWFQTGRLAPSNGTQISVQFYQLSSLKDKERKKKTMTLSEQSERNEAINQAANPSLFINLFVSPSVATLECRHHETS